MLRLLIDENIDHRILRGLKLRLPSLDFVLVKDIGLEGAPDIEMLLWAAQSNRIILTHDVKTMTRDAKQLVKSGQQMAGVIVVPERFSVGTAVKNLVVLLETSSDAGARDRIMNLPLQSQGLQTSD